MPSCFSYLRQSAPAVTPFICPCTADQPSWPSATSGPKSVPIEMSYRAILLSPTTDASLLRKPGGRVSHHDPAASENLPVINSHTVAVYARAAPA